MQAVRVRTSAPFSAAPTRVQHHEPRVVDPAVGIFEAPGVLVEDRRALGIAAQVERARARQLLAAAEMVVEEQPEPHQPGGAVLRAVRQHEAHRPDDVAGRRSAAPRARSAPRAPAGTRNIRDSAGRHAPACPSATRCPRRGRPSRRGSPTGRARRRRARCPAPLMPPPITRRSIIPVPSCRAPFGCRRLGRSAVVGRLRPRAASASQTGASAPRAWHIGREQPVVDARPAPGRAPRPAPSSGVTHSRDAGVHRRIGADRDRRHHRRAGGAGLLAAPRPAPAPARRRRAPPRSDRERAAPPVRRSSDGSSPIAA